MKTMSIIDELKAIQSGELPCGDERRAVCVAYCKRRIELMQNAMATDEPEGLLAVYLPRMREKIELFSRFIAWAERQTDGGK